MNGADYLDRALDLIERYSLRRNDIAWPQFRSAAVAEFGAGASIDDAHPVIRAALKRLGDGHSFFGTPLEVQKAQEQLDRDPSKPSGRCLEGPIGYVEVPAFDGGRPEQVTRFAQQAQDLIRSLDRRGLAGWIVDLRGNTGGNMWPMIAGLGPLLGEGTLGAFIAPGGAKQTWFYRDGAAGCDGEPLWPPSSMEPDGPYLCRVETPYRLAVPEPPVAVLIGARTASAGEAVTLAFRGRPRSRSFGAPTGGLTTCNQMFELSDGAWMFLAVGIEADRTGQIFSSRIDPDEAVVNAGSAVSGDDAVARAASSWLLAGGA